MTLTSEQIMARLQLLLACPYLPAYEPAKMAHTLLEEMERILGLTEESTSVLIGIAALLLRHGVALQVESTLSQAMKH
jgi:hypothetical protein